MACGLRARRVTYAPHAGGHGGGFPGLPGLSAFLRLLLLQLCQCAQAKWRKQRVHVFYLHTTQPPDMVMDTELTQVVHMYMYARLSRHSVVG